MYTDSNSCKLQKCSNGWLSTVPIKGNVDLTHFLLSV